MENTGTHHDSRKWKFFLEELHRLAVLSFLSEVIDGI
jgi:hypothetical protein